MSIRFPNVPEVPGVPAVFRRIQSELAPRLLVEQMKQDALAGPGERKIEWGIFDDNGDLAFEPDSIVAVEPQREYRISDYPIEAGGFESYNKVATPGEVRVTMSKGGSDGDRNAFLYGLDDAVGTLDKYSIVTPEIAYLGYTLTRIDYRRTAQQGAKLIVVEAMFQEVRETATAAFTNSKAPSGAAVVNAGPVQPQTPKATQQPAGGTDTWA